MADTSAMRAVRLVQEPPESSDATVYDYRDQDDSLLFQVVRRPGKKFFQRRPKPGGGWDWRLGEVKRVPFMLPELLDGIASNRVAFVVEGEKDVLAMQGDLEVVATCCPMGAGSWREEFNPYFANSTVVIIPDNDAPGRKHAEQVAENLRTHAAQVRILELPGVGEHGDISDWIDIGGTRANLNKLVQRKLKEPEPLKPRDGPAPAPEAVAQSLPQGKIDPSDPLRSANSFVDERYPERTLRFFDGDFHAWDGSRYKKRNDHAIRAEIYGFLVNKPAIADAGGMIKPRRRLVNDFLDALKAITILNAERVPCWLTDDEPYPPEDIIAFQNGLLHFPTRKLIAPTPGFFNLNAVEFDYEPQAPEPQEWMKFLDRLWEDDREAIATLQEILGLLLTHDTRYQKMFLIVGPKRSGKGTIARIIRALVGPANVIAPTLHGLGQTFGRAAFIGKQVAILSDVRLSGRTDIQAVSENLLRITGEDAISVPRKFREDWTGTLAARFVLLSNEVPALADSSGALASRFIILRMTESFFGREDRRLTEKLLTELPGILNCALDGLERLRDRGYLAQPASGRKAIEQLEKLSSPIAAFVDECCIVESGAKVACRELFIAWQNWCDEQGRDRPGTAPIFGRNLNSAFSYITTAQPRRDGRRYRIYRGIRLRSISDDV